MTANKIIGKINEFEGPTMNSSMASVSFKTIQNTYNNDTGIDHEIAKMTTNKFDGKTKDFDGIKLTMNPSTASVSFKTTPTTNNDRNHGGTEHVGFKVTMTPSMASVSFKAISTTNIKSYESIKMALKSSWTFKKMKKTINGIGKAHEGILTMKSNRMSNTDKIVSLGVPNVPKSSYTEFIHCIEAILNTQEKLNKIRVCLASSKLSQSYATSNPALIAKKMKRLSAELRRVRAIIEFQAQIQIKLQNLNFQSASPLHLNHHRAVLELISVMPKMTAELKDNVQNLEWFIRFHPGTNMEKIKTAVTQTFSLLKYTTKRLREFYNVLQKLHLMNSVKIEASTIEEVLSNFDRNQVCEWKEQKELNNKLLEPLFFIQYSRFKNNRFG